MQRIFLSRFLAPIAVAALTVSCGGATDSEGAGEATNSAGELAEGSGEEFSIPQEPDSFGGTELKEEDASANETSAVAASIGVESQALEAGTVTIESAGVPETGWVVVHADSPDGDVLGYEQLLGPLNPFVSVAVGDSVAAGSQLWAGVYQDLGTADTFEPGTDEPFMDGGEPLGAAFTIE